MAKSKSWWDEYHDDDKPEATKKLPGPRPNPLYNPEPDDEVFVTGFGSGAPKEPVDDDRSSTAYGGYGYSGHSSYGDEGWTSSYRYDEAFDDSDADWYRRNSFRYSKKTDYSPSSLFRSTFSTRSWAGSGDSDDKNKAIRALRNLTRNANTIVDKAVGRGCEYIVQFSNGADSNGLEAQLNDKKQRVIYVSPDELLETKTTDDEDAAIDALTGFVLLRVQISQDVQPEVVRNINLTGMHAVGMKAAVQFYAAQQKLSELRPKEFAGTVTNLYLSGILSKAMLMRLARRGVVSSWGGFAPYFVRHAKKFEAIREKLSLAELSLESLVGCIAYNLINDENPLPLDPAAEAIVAKHLGEERPHEALLTACQDIVEDLRAWLASLASSGGATPPPGEIESALEEMLTEAQKSQAKNGAANAEKNGAFKELAELLSDVAAVDTEHRKAVGDSCSASDKLSSDIRQHASVEQLIKSLEEALKQLKTAEEMAAAGNPTAPEYARGAINFATYQISSRPASADAMRAHGWNSVTDLETELRTSKPEDRSAAELGRLCEMTEAALKEVEELCKKQKPALKEAAQKAITASREMTDKLAALADELLEKVAAAQKKIAENPAVSGLYRMQHGMETLKRVMEENVGYIKQQARDNSETDDTAQRGRALGPFDKAVRTSAYRANMALNALTHNVLKNYELAAPSCVGTEFQNIRESLANSYEDPTDPPDRDSAITAAVNAAKAATEVTDAGFLATMIDAMLGGRLSKMLNGEAKDGELQKLADELGTTEYIIERLIQALQQAENSKRDHTAAKAIGKRAAEQLKAAEDKQCPVDKNLFGEKIACTTRNLTGEAIGQVNDEARNEAEEDYVAYLSHNSTRPKAHTKRTSTGFDAKRVVMSTLRAHRGAVARIRDALQFQSGKRTVETYGLRSGELDEGNLHKLGYDCEHIWAQKTISKLPDVAVGILVDQSGSMNSGHKIDQAREMCILLAEALRKIAGVRLHVYGHTANMGGHDDMTIFEHYTPSDGADLSRLGGIRAYSNNYDGYAVKEVARRLAQDPAKKKYLFVIADGLPSGSGYGGEEGVKHVTSVCRFTRDRLKIGTYAFAVGVTGHSQHSFKRQYGDKHVVFVNQVQKCLPQIVRFLRNALQQERKLVGVAE
jgi:hypothetical protein